MVGTAEIESDAVPPPSSPVDDDEDIEIESVSDSDSVTTEDVLDTIRPRNMPAVRIQALMDLPAWFIVLTSYVFALGLGWFSTSSSCK